MSEPLRDVRTKVTSLTWVMAEAESRATGKDQSEILREVLHGWAEQKLRVFRVAQQLLKATGNDGEGEGT